ncbi:methyltransferase [Candidatus Woesearchaeota archaeon]|nr:methyltransferase [Candidatus Woesearchaeota archaeon]
MTDVQGAVVNTVVTLHGFEVYLPHEDSFFLQQAVRDYARGMVLDMGTGTGIQAVEAAKKRNVSRVVAVDKNTHAIGYCKARANTSKYNRKITFLVSDLFSALQRKQFGAFDTIIFNPPYLPSDPSFPDMALDGGKYGFEVIEQFLSQASAHLKQDGCILLLFSTLSNQQKVHDAIARYAFQYSLVAQQKLSFETLFVYKITKMPLLVALENRGIRHVQWFSKGKRGIIYTGLWKKKQVAIKMRRPESMVDTIDHEIHMLQFLNKHGIGPAYLGKGKIHGKLEKTSELDQQYMIYQFVHGSFIMDALARASKQQALFILREVFLQMRKLDILQVNKEEMHHPYKHVLVSFNNQDQKRPKVTLLDFERCRRTPTPQNVTQFCQCIISTRMQHLLQQKGFSISKPDIIQAAWAYKKQVSNSSKRSHFHFRSLLQLLS